jgi:hypothetical protein
MTRYELIFVEYRKCWNIKSLLLIVKRNIHLKWNQNISLTWLCLVTHEQFNLFKLLQCICMPHVTLRGSNAMCYVIVWCSVWCWLLLVCGRSPIFFCDLLIGWCCVLFPLCMPLILLCDTSPHPYPLSINWAALKGSFEGVLFYLHFVCLCWDEENLCYVISLLVSIWSQIVLAKNFAKGGDCWIFCCWHHFAKTNMQARCFMSCSNIWIPVQLLCLRFLFMESTPFILGI